MRLALFDHWRRYPSTARDWVVRVQAGDMTRDEQLALDAWLKGDHANAEAFSRLNKLGHFGLRMREHPNLVENLPGYASWKRRRRNGWAKRRRALLLACASAAATLTLIVLVPGLLTKAGNTYATARGEQRQVALADGSRMAINTDSEVSVRFSGLERRVELDRGEAYFDVAKDAARPFIVRAGTSEVRAVGTRFSVRVLGGLTSVVVVEGLVSVAPTVETGQGRVRLGQGDRAVVSPKPGASAVDVSQVDADRATAWLGGYLDFDDATLSSVVAEVNRYALRPLRIEDESLRTIRLSARFKVGDVEALKFALRDRLGVTALDEGAHIALRLR